MVGFGGKAQPTLCLSLLPLFSVSFCVLGLGLWHQRSRDNYVCKILENRGKKGGNKEISES